MAKDTNKSIVQDITANDFSDLMNKLWVQLFDVDQKESTWEDHATLKNVEAFHHTYCAANKISAFLPKMHPLYSASIPSKQQRTPARFDISEPPLRAMIGPANKRKKRGETATNTMAASKATETEITRNGLETIAMVQGKTRKWGRPPKKSSEVAGRTRQRKSRRLW